MDLELVEFGRAKSDTPPSDPPPSADAPYAERAEWSARYVTWLVEHTQPDGPLPTDVRATHLYEIEFISCVEDPEAYMRNVEPEATRIQAVH